MDASCQRCHETLRDEDRYCANCGLPQLIYVASELPLVAMMGGDGQELGVAGSPVVSAGGIAWRPALTAALTLAIPTGILCFGVLPIGMIWMVGAAAWSVTLYARRSRAVGVSLGVGVRIGMMTGLFASWLTVSLYAIGFWVSRFVLHQGGEWDSLWLGQAEKSNQQMLAEMSTNAQSLEVAQSLRNLTLSAEGRAGLPLLALVMLAMLLIFFAILGGALGAKMQAQPSRSRS